MSDCAHKYKPMQLCRCLLGESVRVQCSWRVMLPNRYSGAKMGDMPFCQRTGFGCVWCRLCCRLFDYDSESVPDKGCVRDCQPKVQVAGSIAGGFAGETLQFADGGGLRAVGAAVLEIPSESGGELETSP